MLLDDIIELASDDKRKLSVVLRKCLILAQKLKNERLKVWANQELNGYSSGDSVPEYRILSTIALGDFAGFGGAFSRNFPIPVYVLREDHRHWVTTVHLTQEVGALEDMVSNTTERSLRFPWPTELVALYQDELTMENG